jgi:hypothetical protein
MFEGKPKFFTIADRPQSALIKGQSPLRRVPGRGRPMVTRKHHSNWHGHSDGFLLFHLQYRPLRERLEEDIGRFAELL